MAYRCRAYPDEAQQQVFARTFGCVRVVWNRTLAARHARCTLRARAFLTPSPTGNYRHEKRSRPGVPVRGLLGAAAADIAAPAQGVYRLFCGARTLPAVQVPPLPPGCALHPVGFLPARGKLRLAKTAARFVRVVLAGRGHDRARSGDGDHLAGTRRPLVRDLHHRHPGPQPLPPGRPRGRDRPRREGLRCDHRTGSGSPTRAIWSAKPATWPAISDAWLAAAGLREPGQGEAKVARAHRKVRRRPARLPAPRQ